MKIGNFGFCNSIWHFYIYIPKELSIHHLIPLVDTFLQCTRYFELPVEMAPSSYILDKVPTRACCKRMF